MCYVESGESTTDNFGIGGDMSHAASTARVYEAIRRREKLSPRVKHALRLVASGAANQNEAARAFGLNPAYLSVVKNQSPEADRIMSEMDQQIGEKAVDTSAILRALGRKALAKVGSLMSFAEKEEIQLKAAQDILDRNPETSKVQRHQDITPSIDPAAARILAAALVEGAKVLNDHGEIAAGDFVHAGDQSLEPKPKELTDGSQVR